MRSFLQINLNLTNISKNLYSIKKNKLQLYPYPNTIIDQQKLQLDFDKICYSHQDINSSILYDIIIEKVQKNNTMKNICLIFDQMSEQKVIENLIIQIRRLDMFRDDKIQLSHFLIENGNSLYDYFNRNSKNISISDRENIEKEGQQNFMLNFHKQMNLCEEVKPYQVAKIKSMTKYLEISEYLDNLTKQQSKKSILRQQKQIESRKISEFYIIKIGDKLELSCINFNYNKNYTVSAQQKKDNRSIFTLYNSDTPQIKFKTVKSQVISTILNNSDQLYYITYFPGPQSQKLNINKSSLHNSSYNTNKSSLFCSKIGQNSPKSTSPLKSKYKSKQQIFQEYFQQIFHNYRLLKKKNKQQIQNIIKEYIQKKQEVIKIEVDRVRESVKQLKIAHRIEKFQVDQIKNKTIKALEKMGSSIKQLQKMGIRNIGKHIAWLQMITQQKKQQIKQQEQAIEQINQRIVENQQQHEYFVKKMCEYRDRLILKLRKDQRNIFIESKQFEQKQNIIKSDQAANSIENGSRLTETQIQDIQIYKEDLRNKMNKRLRNCFEKKNFMQKLANIKPKISKMQFSRLQQKYFDLIID